MHQEKVDLKNIDLNDEKYSELRKALERVNKTQDELLASMGLNERKIYSAYQKSDVEEEKL